MSDKQPIPASEIKVRIPLWIILDALHDSNGDQYVTLRDAIIQALSEENEEIWELTCK